MAEGRRNYDQHLPSAHAPNGPSNDGDCLLRNQPRRNLALAGLVIAEGEYDRVVYSLCAPKRHPTIWGRYYEFRELFADNHRVGIRTAG